MRGESLEPGGCSAWPTSGRIALRIACPALVGAAAGLSEVALALCSCEAKAVVPVAGAVVVVDGAGVEGAGGANSVCSCTMRAITTSKLIHDLHRPHGARALDPDYSPVRDR